MSGEITIAKMGSKGYESTVQMVTQLMNYHRQLVGASKEFWQTDAQSRETLEDWQGKGKVYHIFAKGQLAGFFYIRFGGQKAAWLEDLYIIEEFRGQGIGKLAMAQLDQMLIEQGILAIFINVIPRNTKAIKFYQNCGFDHLNMIELRKNYDKSMDKDEEGEVMGFRFKKY